MDGGAGLVATGLAPARAQGPAAAPLSGVARLICGFPAGGTLDIVGRQLAELWRGRLAETVIVDNRVGAGGRLAINATKDAAPDGRTILISPSPMLTLYPSLYRNLGYDPDADLTAVSTVCVFTYALAVGPMVPASVTTVAGFLEWARANPEQAAFASPAAGSTPHFMGTFCSAARRRRAGTCLTAAPGPRSRT